MNSVKDIADRLIYLIVAGLLKLTALLPLGVLYVFSDVLRFFVYHVLRYRRRVVRDNLVGCFPTKTDRDIRRIERRFYRNFVDYIFETVKLLHLSDREIERRVTFEGLENIDFPLAMGKSVTVYFSHTGNWEWTPSVRLHSRYGNERDVVFGQIYRPLRNACFDRLMLKIRGRFDTLNIAKKRTLRVIVETLRANRRFVIGFMSDQKPSHGDAVRIVSFFGRPTAVITGTETVARRFGTAVVYWEMSKPARGHYHVRVVPMAEDGSQTQPGQLTAAYFELLERNIRRQPDLWLWSHKRWKNSPSTWDEVDPETLVRK